MKNSLSSDLNEIATGYCIVHGNWSKFQNNQEAKILFHKRKSQLSSKEYQNQIDRSKRMACEVIRWAKSNGYCGKVEQVWWTARTGILSTVIGQDCKNNPSDILLKFDDGALLGLSLKSSQTNGNLKIKNVGIGTLGIILNVNFMSSVFSKIDNTFKKCNLPNNKINRKKYIRNNPKIQKYTRKIGNEVLLTLRNELFETYKKLNQDKMVKHLETVWLNSNKTNFPYIRVNGFGEKGNRGVLIEEPNKLKWNHISIKKTGNNSINFLVDDKPFIRLRLKWDTEPLAGCVKLSGELFK